MGNSSAFVLICAIMAVHMVLTSSAVDFSGDHLQFQLGWIPARSACQGSIAECLAGEEFEMDSEINRRILASKRYISYGALSRNSVPCSRRGASYYNCRLALKLTPTLAAAVPLLAAASAFDAVIAHTSFLHPNSPMESELIKDLIEALLIS
ncbi:Protein RALF-like 33 [Vitis vinifera]|uniref:Protein RALF-like 33 n=1 Tax=Vitis vinifera TaxID=29760 RepID=A0A438KKT3_VITVI|nr:Protein RALF-like 33 [Vitis vinifera]